MQVIETQSEGLKRAYKATATAEEISGKVNEKLEEAREQATLPGFRKGKVPVHLLKQRYGENLMGEVVQELVDGAINEHLSSAEHRPARQPKVEIVNKDFSEGDDLNIEFSYELMPEIPEIPSKGISLERLTVEVGDEALEEALQELAQNAKSYDEKDGAAEDGDQVVIDFLGKIDGEAFEGGAGEDFPLVLGSGQFIPGYEEQLVGLKAGEAKDVELNFPENYGASHLAGKAAVFETTVKEVRGPKASELDDELAKKYGEDDLESLKGKLRERLGEEYKTASRALMKRKLLDALDEKMVFPLPESMVDPEAKEIAHQMWRDENPDAQGQDQPEIETTDEHVKLAERRVKLGLLLSHVGEQNKIEVSDQEIGGAIMEQARQYPGREREFFEFVQKNAQMRQQLAAPIFEDKVVDYLFELVEVSDRAVSADDLKAEFEAATKDD